MRAFTCNWESNVLLGIFLQGTAHLCHACQDSRSDHVPKRMTLRQGNAGCAYPAIVKMEGVLGRSFGNLPDSQRKRDQLFGPQFVKHLLRFCFQGKWLAWHEMTLHRVGAQDNRAMPEVSEKA